MIKPLMKSLMQPLMRSLSGVSVFGERYISTFNPTGTPAMSLNFDSPIVLSGSQWDCELKMWTPDASAAAVNLLNEENYFKIQMNGAGNIIANIGNGSAWVVTLAGSIQVNDAATHTARVVANYGFYELIVDGVVDDSELNSNTVTPRFIRAGMRSGALNDRGHCRILDIKAWADGSRISGTEIANVPIGERLYDESNIVNNLAAGGTNATVTNFTNAAARLYREGA